MAHQPTHDRQADHIRRQMLQTTVRFGIIIAILLAFLYGFPRLPGTERELHEMTTYTITVGTIGYGIITLLLFGAILSYATSIGSLLGERFSFRQVERIVQLIALLGVIIWAHRVFYWFPYFESNPEQYDLLFLILGIGVAAWLGFILYTNADEVSELFTDKVITDPHPGQAEQPSGVNRGPHQQPVENQTDGGVHQSRRSGADHGRDPSPQPTTETQPRQEPDEPNQVRADPADPEPPRTESVTSEPSQPDPNDPQEPSDSSTQESPQTETTDPIQSADNQSQSEQDQDINEHVEKACPDCGTTVPGEAKFCHSCGTTLEEVND